ncbi:hypothetical protein V6N13_064503 [Hibiscus sabdariffa]
MLGSNITIWAPHTKPTFPIQQLKPTLGLNPALPDQSLHKVLPLLTRASNPLVTAAPTTQRRPRRHTRWLRQPPPQTCPTPTTTSTNHNSDGSPHDQIHPSYPNSLPSTLTPQPSPHPRCTCNHLPTTRT